MSWSATLRCAFLALIVVHGLTLCLSKPSVGGQEENSPDTLELPECKDKCYESSDWTCSDGCFCVYADNQTHGTCYNASSFVDYYTDYVLMNETAMALATPVPTTQ